MVDAINGIDPKKIDWYRITLKEVQEYQSEGMDDDMPSEVKRWVEEMAKTANVPDSVTYEMSQSESSTDINNNETKNSEETPPINTFEQALNMGNQSDIASGEVESLMAEIEEWNASAAAAYNEAGNAYTSAMDKINSLMRERENALKSGDSAKAAALGEKITSTGNTSQDIINGHYSNIEQIQGNVEGFATIAENAISIGMQTNEMASTELQNAGYFRRIQLNNTIAQGTNAINTGNNGLGESLSAQSEIYEFGRNVRSYMGDIQDVSGATMSINTNNGKSKNNTKKTEDIVDKEKTNNTKDKNADKADNKKESTELDKKAKEDEIKDPALSDKDITTDILELIKRKERRGEA